MRSQTLKADLALLLVSFLWGLTFPLVRTAVTQMDSFHFLFFRFFLAGCTFFLLLTIRQRKMSVSSLISIRGLGLGVIAWAAYLSQTIGLETIPSGRSAFITGTNVILVPLLAPLFHVGKPSAWDFSAAVLALVGLALMTNPFQGYDALAIGDLWTLLCALICAIYILSMQKVLQKEKTDSGVLAFSQVVAVMVASFLVLPLGTAKSFSWNPSLIAAILFCALFATVGTFWLQTRFQKDTTPQRAALIFATEPVFALVFGYFLLHETMTWIGYVGAGLILFSLVAAEMCKAKSSGTGQESQKELLKTGTCP